VLFRPDRWRLDRQCDMPTSDVIYANSAHPDFRYCRPSSSTLRAGEEHKENRRQFLSYFDDDVIQPHFRFADGDRNRKCEWSSMKRTSTARSSLQLCTARILPEVSDIRPEVDEGGTLLGDDSSVSDIDDIFSVTENQPSTMYLPNSKYSVTDCSRINRLKLAHAKLPPSWISAAVFFADILSDFNIINIGYIN